MKENIKQFLESSLLEEYVLGTIDQRNISEVEKFIRDSDEVKSAYEELQGNLELLASRVATTPPLGTKEKIIKRIDESIAAHSSSVGIKRLMMLAASIAAALFCILSLYLYQQNGMLKNEVNQVKGQYADLHEQCSEQQNQYAAQQEKWNFIGDVKTERFSIIGNDKAPELETIAYWNKDKQASYLQILSIPKLSNERCFQLWADVDGKMVSVDILPTEEGQIVAIPFKASATSLNITIEPKGGSDHPTIANLVGSVVI